jgi:hypothetical protein
MFAGLVEESLLLYVVFTVHSSLHDQDSGEEDCLIAVSSSTRDKYGEGISMTRLCTRKTGTGLTVDRCFTGSGKGAVPQISWGDRIAAIHGSDGRIAGTSICEAPVDWPQLAVDTAVSRYFTPSPDIVLPKTSVRVLVQRVTKAIAARGRENEIFQTAQDAAVYQAELTAACFARYGWFSQSVWREVGIAHPRVARHLRQAVNAAARDEFKLRKPSYLPIHASDEFVCNRKTLQIIAQKAHKRGAATIHFDETIAAWHTCPASGTAVGATPSDGYLFLANSTCKLATINVNRVLDNKGRLDIDALQYVATLFTIALDILVDIVDYPATNTAHNSRDHRPIGLSYAGLAPLLMRLSIPYGSDSGRTYAAALTSFITATVCATSQKLALATEPFSKYKANQVSMLAVIRQHEAAGAAIQVSAQTRLLHTAAQRAWRGIIKTAPATGLRNAQFTMLAAAGSAGLILDCHASDIGPVGMLVKYTATAYGKTERHVNPCVEKALTTLGYSAEACAAILAHILDKETIEDSPGLKPKHMSVFDCAFPSRRGGSRAISIEGQLAMLAAVQPLISGCTQRSLILPKTVSVKQVATLIKNAWRLGIRTLDLYRSGSVR